MGTAPCGVADRKVPALDPKLVELSFVGLNDRWVIFEQSIFVVGIFRAVGPIIGAGDDTRLIKNSKLMMHQAMAALLSL